MPRHDSIFKELLRSFLADLLGLVVPEVASRLDLARLAFLDKEFFTAGRRRRELDLLARVPVHGGGALLVHVEVEARARPDMGRRLWRYRNQIQAVHDTDILSIVINLQRGPAGVEVRGLADTPLGPGLSDFRYVAFGVAGCVPEEYLARPEPLAWGLAALMRGGRLSRPALKLACLQRIAASPLDDGKRGLLVNCVETYLELNSEEAAEYAALYTVRENREVRTMATTWAERLEAKGREEGLQEGFEAMRTLLLSQLEQRFGPLPEEAVERIEAISSLRRLTQLGQRILSARSLESLKLR